MKIVFAPFALSKKIHEYDVTMPVLQVRVTPQINCGDVKMLKSEETVLSDNDEISDR